MKWTEEIFGTKKAIIGLVHMQPLPGDPQYDEEGGMEKIIRMARADVLALQNGGVDGLLFTNEYSMPYLEEVDHETVAAMAYVMGALKGIIKLPYGNDCIYDSAASVSLAAATGACFTRGIYHGVWATSEGLMGGMGAKAARLRRNLGLKKFKLIYYFVPESSADLGGRDAFAVMKPTYVLNIPDGIAIGGVVAGNKPDPSIIKECSEKYPDSVIFAATGVKFENVQDYMEYMDGAFVGTSFKKDGVFWNQIDETRVKEFMDKVKSLREN